MNDQNIPPEVNNQILIDDMRKKTQKIRSLLGAVFLTIIVLVTYAYIEGITFSDIVQTGARKQMSASERLKSKPAIAKVIAEQESANSRQVFEKLDTLSRTETNKSNKESLKLYAASSLIGLDRNQGADYYISIANDLNNTNIVRAYAMTQIAQYASGDGNVALLKVFFKDPTVTKKMSSDTIKLEVNKRILETYPMPLAAANVARYELKKKPTKENAQLLRDIYLGTVTQGIKDFEGVDGLSHFIPSTYLVTADFLRSAEKVGVSTTSEVRSYFDRAYSSSLADNQAITKQFIMLSYADYLLSVSKTEDAEKVLRVFVSEGLTTMVSTNLTSTKGENIQYVIKYMNTSKSPTAVELSKKISSLLKK